MLCCFHKWTLKVTATVNPLGSRQHLLCHSALSDHWVAALPFSISLPCSILSSQHYMLIKMNNGRIHPEIWKYSKTRLCWSLICSLWPMACALKSYSAIGKHHQTAVNVQRRKGNTEVS